MSRCVITIAIWLLGFVVLAVLGLAVSVTCYGAIQAESPFQDPQVWSLVPAAGISAGVLIAILAFTRDRERIDREQTRHTSQVMLERASSAFYSAVSLLRDQNNERVLWIRAARYLRRGVDLGEEIVDPDYRRAYELEVEQTRHDLYDALTILNEETGAREALPPQFFYGIDDWKSDKTLDEAAIEASDEVNVYSVTIDENPPEARLSPLAVRSVIAIYDFLRYPDNYDDPLDRVSDWPDNWDNAHGIDAGARRYVAHAKRRVHH